MADWTDLSGVFTFGSQLTSVQQQNLRDNVVYVKDHSNMVINGGFPIATGVTGWTEQYRFNIYKKSSMLEMYSRNISRVTSGSGRIRTTYYDSSSNTYAYVNSVIGLPYSAYDHVFDVSTFDNGWGTLTIESIHDYAFGQLQMETFTAMWDVSSV